MSAVYLQKWKVTKGVYRVFSTRGGYDVESDSSKKYLIRQIVKILNSIDSIDLLAYFYYFIQAKLKER